MKQTLATMLALTLSAAPALAEADYPPTPHEIVEAAPAPDWVRIAPEDLLVMDLEPDAKGKPRRVVIQLMPPPFSQGWVENIRTLAKARWYDGISVNRVQDNYVVQWGDADGEDAAKAKPLPGGLNNVPESEYAAAMETNCLGLPPSCSNQPRMNRPNGVAFDNYANGVAFARGFPIGTDWGIGRPTLEFRKEKLVAKKPKGTNAIWPVHCYGMVGVGRGLSPDTGTGAELYTVIGHAPRHLDRNIAVVGRVIEGIEHLSSLPRGTGPLGFYETAEERVPIVSVRLGDEVDGLPAYEYLSTETGTFAAYTHARANRHDEFFIKPAGGADICNIPVPVRRVK